MMALAPAFQMSLELPAGRAPLPVLKVLYRNSQRIQEKGGRKSEVLLPVIPAPVPTGRPIGEAVRDAARRKDMAAAEGTFASLAHAPVAQA